MDEPIAVLDVCVLYPAPLRDLLMHLALVDAFRARWTEEIHAEWMRNVLANRPDLRSEQLERTRELMNLHARDALIGGYESLTDTLTLPDSGDWHVLAAAIYSKADQIVTFNLRDFPKKSLSPFGIEAVHPDNFILRLIESDAEKVVRAAERQRQSLKNPPKSREEFLSILSVQKLQATVEKLQSLFESL